MGTLGQRHGSVALVFAKIRSVGNRDPRIAAVVSALLKCFFYFFFDQADQFFHKTALLQLAFSRLYDIQTALLLARQ